MKQTMVVKVTITNGDKSRSKALKTAVSLSGVESASLKGDDQNLIEVTGDGVDPVQLTLLLKKKVGGAELLSVGGEKKVETQQPEEPSVPVWLSPPICIYEVPHGYCHCHDDNYSLCSIL